MAGNCATHTRWLVVWACVLLWSGASPAQSPQLRAAYAQAEALYAKRDYRNGLPAAEYTLRLSEREFGPEHPNTATVLDSVARVRDALGQPARAEKLYRRALTIKERTLGHNHPRVATTLNNIANLLSASDRHVEAEMLYIRALTILGKTTAQRDLRLATVLSGYAALLRDTGREAAAAVLDARIKAIRQR